MISSHSPGPKRCSQDSIYDKKYEQGMNPRFISTKAGYNRSNRKPCVAAHRKCSQRLPLSLCRYAIDHQRRFRMEYRAAHTAQHGCRKNSRIGCTKPHQRNGNPAKQRPQGYEPGAGNAVRIIPEQRLQYGSNQHISKNQRSCSLIR